MSVFQFIPFLIVYSILTAVSGVLIFFDFKREHAKIRTWNDLIKFFKLTGIYIVVCVFWFLINVWTMVDFR